MPEHGVPEHVPTATAANIAGVPPARFRAQYIDAGLVEVTRERGRVLVDTQSLETALGVWITCRRYCLAERERDRARRYQRNYRLSACGGADVAPVRVGSFPEPVRAAEAAL